MSALELRAVLLVRLLGVNSARGRSDASKNGEGQKRRDDDLHDDVPSQSNANNATSWRLEPIMQQLTKDACALGNNAGKKQEPCRHTVLCHTEGNLAIHHVRSQQENHHTQPGGLYGRRSRKNSPELVTALGVMACQ